MTLLQLRIDLFDGLKTDTNDNQNASSAEWEILVGPDPDERNQRDHCH
ncbi:50S ribosomal protein L15 [marine actinobacterium PHSC20C1]|nr:50S ribosomal protein L15 [marine actinobacterium PHSC20C1]